MAFDFAPYQFIDIHYHASPDLYTRRWNALNAGRIYQSCHGAVVLKSHLGSTAVHASLAQDLGLPVFPSVVLNHIAGGIDYRVILRALAEYKASADVRMLVHFPTITGRAHRSKLSRQLSHPSLAPQALMGETLFNDRQQLKKAVIDILKLTKDYPIVLSTGHASQAETYRLIEACEQQAVPALLLNQPANPLTGLNAQQLLVITTQYDFVWVEQTLLTYLLGYQSRDDFFTVLSSVPRVIYSSDLGQPNQMDIADWLQCSATLFQEGNVSMARQDEIWRNNPAALLAL